MNDAPPARRTRARKLALAALSLVAAVLAAELGVRAWGWAWGRPYSVWRTEQAIRETVVGMTGLLAGADDAQVPPAGSEEPPGDGPQEPPGGAPQDGGQRGILYALHPYTGFETPAGVGLTERIVEYFEQGDDAGHYTVFVQGGSVAAIFAGWSMGGIERLKRRLAADPALEGREPRTFRLAVPGFKQPQQLMQLAYLLSRGCRPDMVVNLDGLNEVRIGRGNAAKGVQPTWPSLGHWAGVAARGVALDEAVQDQMLEARLLQRRAQALGDAALARRYAYSAILGRLTLSQLARLRAAWARAQERYVSLQVGDLREELRADPFGVAPEPERAVRDAVDCWFESSLAMHQLCAARGIRYVHLLQPTLHDEGSKPVTDEEFQRGIGEGGLDRAVVEGYPLLREGVAELRRRGVEAYDLTAAFADVEETLYTDSCHVGKKGNRLLADRVADALGLPPLER